MVVVISGALLLLPLNIINTIIPIKGKSINKQIALTIVDVIITLPGLP